MKNLNILLAAAVMVTAASCGSSYYSSSIEDGIYYRPSKSEAAEFSAEKEDLSELIAETYASAETTVLRGTATVTQVTGGSENADTSYNINIRIIDDGTEWYDYPYRFGFMSRWSIAGGYYGPWGFYDPWYWDWGFYDPWTWGWGLSWAGYYGPYWGIWAGWYPWWGWAGCPFPPAPHEGSTYYGKRDHLTSPGISSGRRGTAMIAGGETSRSSAVSGESGTRPHGTLIRGNTAVSAVAKADRGYAATTAGRTSAGTVGVAGRIDAASTAPRPARVSATIYRNAGSGTEMRAVSGSTLYRRSTQNGRFGTVDISGTRFNRGSAISIGNTQGRTFNNTVFRNSGTSGIFSRPAQGTSGRSSITSGSSFRSGGTGSRSVGSGGGGGLNRGRR